MKLAHFIIDAPVLLMKLLTMSLKGRLELAKEAK